MSDCFDHAADAYDDLCFGRTADEGYGLSRRTGKWQALGKTCKFCGTTDLHWHQKDGKWKLCIKGKPHDCIPKAPNSLMTRTTMSDKPASPAEAEELAKKAVGDYLTACRMTGREQIGNYLMKLASVAGVLMAQAEGSAEAACPEEDDE